MEVSKAYKIVCELLKNTRGWKPLKFINVASLQTLANEQSC